MQDHQHRAKAPAIANQTASPTDIRVDLAQINATKIEAKPLVDGALFLRCFADAPNAFVS